MAKLSSLTLVFLEQHPDDAARVLEHLPLEETVPLLALTPPQTMAPVVERMLPTPAAQTLNALDDARAAAILGAMSMRNAAVLLRQLPAKKAAILKLLPRLRARSIRRQLEYPLETVGAWMDPAVLRMRPTIPAEQALELVRRHADEGIETIYVVGDNGRLLGCVEFASLVRARPRLSLGRLARRPAQVLKATADLSWIRDDPAWLRTNLLPVLDQWRLVGALHQADLHRGLEQQAPSPEHVITGEMIEAGAQMYWMGLSTLMITGLAWLRELAQSSNEGGHIGR